MNVYEEAYQKGYRIRDGILYNPDGKIIKGSLTGDGYRSTRITKKGDLLFYHRFVAYQKYGNKIFEDGIETRHLDSNPLNNLDDNIAIGTHKENMMDMPKRKRVKRAIHAQVM